MLALSRGGLSARTIGRLVTLTLGLLAGLPVLLSLASLYTDPGYGRADLRAAAQFVTHQRQPDEIVLHLGAFTQAPFDYYGVASPSRVLETNQRSELCGAIHGTPGGWLVTAYAADDDQARDAAEAGITDPGYAGGLVHQAPYRVLGASVFHLVGDCAFYP